MDAEFNNIGGSLVTDECQKILKWISKLLLESKKGFLRTDRARHWPMISRLGRIQTLEGGGNPCPMVSGAHYVSGLMIYLLGSARHF